jgi:hypothetical protein
MHFDLGPVRVHLETESERVRASISGLLRGWGRPSDEDKAWQVRVRVQLASQAPERPKLSPIYRQESSARPGSVGCFEVFTTGLGVDLRFEGCAQISVPLSQPEPGQAVVIDGVVLPDIWKLGCFSDVLYSALAPVLRRMDIFLLHGFAVTRAGECIILTGPSGSGKTTSGLILMEGGWSFMSNDVVALARMGHDISAMPTPDAISVTTATLDFLPWLMDRVEGRAATGKIGVWREGVVNQPAPAPVKRIYFLEVKSQPNTVIRPLERALALAWLVEGSMDRWDHDSLGSHLDFLSQLSEQVSLYRLLLGRDAPEALDSLVAS